MSDTLSGTTHPDDNDDHPWWGLPCTVTPCFGARLVQEGNRLHYLADRAGIRGRFSRGNVVDRVIEGAYEVVGVFDRIEEKHDAMQSLVLSPPARQALAQAALTYRYGDEHQPVTTADILTPRRREDYGQDLWSAYQTIQENMLKGGISGRSAKGKRIHTRAIHNIDTDIKLNRALWVMAETLLESLR